MATIAQPAIVTIRPISFVNRSERSSSRGILKLLQVEPVYHIIAAILYVSGGIGVMAVIGDLAGIFASWFAAGFLGAFAGFLHSIHGYYSWKDWQAQKYQPIQIPQVVQPGQTPYVAAQPAPAIVVQASYPTVQAPNQQQQKK